MSKYPSADKEKLVHAVLKAGVWQFGDYVFASGKTANNKFEMPSALKDEYARRLLVPAIARLAIRGEVDGIWGAPEGGQLFAEAVAEMEGLSLVRLEAYRADNGLKRFRFQRHQEEIAVSCDSLVGIEDVITEGGTIWSILQQIPLLKAKTRRLAAGWIRGHLQYEFDIPVNGAIEEVVPNQISTTHPFFLKYGYLAVNEAMVSK